MNLIQRSDSSATSNTGAQPHSLTTSAALALLVAVAVAALATRFWMLGDKALWLDEAFSWALTKLSISAMVETTAHDDVHPPLLYMILHFWTKFFGDSEASMRMPGALSGSAGIVLMAAVAWRVGGARLAALTAALIILNPAFLQYNQEARFYPVIGLFALSSTVALVRFITRPVAWALVVYVALAIALAYTHNSGLIVIGVQGLVFGWYGVVQWTRERRYTILLGGAVAGLSIAAAYGPWWTTLFDQIHRGGGFVQDPSVNLVGATLRGGLGLKQTHALWVIFAMPLVAAIVWGLFRHRDDPWVMGMAALALVPVALLVASYSISNVFDTKRASPFILPLAFVSALGIVEVFDSCKSLPARYAGIARGSILAGIVLLSVAMGIGVRNYYDRGPQEDWPNATRDAQRQPGPIFYYRDYLNDPINYYVADRSRFYPLPQDPAGILAMLARAANELPSEGGMLILSHSMPDETATLMATIGGRYEVGAAESYSSGTIELYPLISKQRPAIEAAAP